MAFGEKLKELREQSGLTQEQLAQKLYVSRTAVSKWETGKGYPSIDSLKAIQTSFGASIDDLIGEEDVDAGLAARQRFSRKLYWCAIGCLVIAVALTWVSLLVMWSGHIPWVLPLRVTAAMAIAGYIAFAFASKARYSPKPSRSYSAKRYIASRVIVGMIVLGAIVLFISSAQG